MAFVATDKDGAEYIHYCCPVRDFNSDASIEVDGWVGGGDCIPLPKGSIRKLIGRELTWENEPVELKGECR